MINRRDVLKGGIAGLLGNIINPVIQPANSNEWCPLGLTCIEVAINHNIMVYDNEATTGEFTTRLFGFLREIMNDNREWLGTPLSRQKINIAHLYTSSKLNLDWKPQDCTINYQPNILDEFNRLCGSLASGKNNLVVALGDGGEILLGSY